MPKILAVDDSATMRRIYEMTFAGQSGFEVLTANGSEQALRSAAGVDLVLVDASMAPSGYDLARSLRDGGFLSPIVLLASQHSPYDVERARAAGIDDHLLKPFDTQSLLDKSRDVLQRGRGDAGRAPSAVAAAPPSPTRASVPTPTVLTPAVALPSAPGSSPAPARATFAKPAAAYGVPAAKPAAAVPPSAIVGGSGAAVRPASSASEQAVGEMAGKLSQMGLTPEQVEGILALSREVVERVVWEVVPEVAERLVREEIKRLTA